MECINARNCIFSKQKAEKISEKGHSCLSKRHPTGKETPLPGYTLSPHKKKGKVGAYDNLILYQEHALKKALILLYMAI